MSAPEPLPPEGEVQAALIGMEWDLAHLDKRNPPPLELIASLYAQFKVLRAALARRTPEGNLAQEADNKWRYKVVRLEAENQQLNREMAEMQDRHDDMHSASRHAMLQLENERLQSELARLRQAQPSEEAVERAFEESDAFEFAENGSPQRLAGVKKMLDAAYAVDFPSREPRPAQPPEAVSGPPAGDEQKEG